MERNSELKNVGWLALGATVVNAVLGGLVAMGVFPAEGLAATIVGALLAVSKAVGDYAKSRGEKKAAEALAAAVPVDPS